MICTINLPKVPGIYSITNIINNKCYIGSTINLYRRFYNHKFNLNNNRHCNKYLQSSYNKYNGKFEFSILETTSDISNIEKRETFWINYYCSNNKKFGYNLRVVTESNRGLITSEETRIRISNATKGQKRKPLSFEHKEKIRSFQKTKVLSEETKEKISKNHSRHKLGVKNSIETRKKISQSLIGKSPSYETLQKKSISMRGKNSKFCKEDILEIRKLIKEGQKLKDIAVMFNVNPVTISDIKRNIVWSHIQLES